MASKELVHKILFVDMMKLKNGKLKKGKLHSKAERYLKMTQLIRQNKMARQNKVLLRLTRPNGLYNW